MIAEIKNKTTTGEDELTGNFFGTLRYLKFEDVLLPVLMDTSHCENENDSIKRILSEQIFDENKFEFWKKAEGLGEIDCYMENDNVAIGIEVKYNSDLSSEDQLIREAKMLKKWAVQKHKILLFIAKNKESCERPYYNNYLECQNLNVTLFWCSWKEIYNKLKEISNTTRYNNILINDVLEFLKIKGFESFEKFDVDMPDISNECFTFEYNNIYLFNFRIFDCIERGFYEFRK